MDCFICNDVFKASQYRGVIFSIPSRVPTRSKVGCHLPSSSTAISLSLSSYMSGPSPVLYTFKPTSGYFFTKASIQRAVAEGPNHSPGYLPHSAAPCSTKRCIEKGASGASAKRERMGRSSCFVAGSCRRQSMVVSFSECRDWQWETYLVPTVALPGHWRVYTGRIESCIQSQSLR